MSSTGEPRLCSGPAGLRMIVLTRCHGVALASPDDWALGCIASPRSYAELLACFEKNRRRHDQAEPELTNATDALARGAGDRAFQIRLAHG
jgi:hypothetical protein